MKLRPRGHYVAKCVEGTYVWTVVSQPSLGVIFFANLALIS
jgi:hypothetical protein